ncbi:MULTISPECIES: FAD:protein FMN transferase [Serratia]|uniref:FAD:protein FMN transferase n=1 Tax=Serratia TaxID=613 RepID=UPI000537EA35|nr:MULTISPECIES: FAD:protein FMN transferase [Serratia]AUU09479.1 FAD:protein FMN transferase [Serratia marcescens]AVD61709.1 FAD:protein FMN transferase [Serratia marcescens]ELL0331609.1 FAD:protein FMN transferase [Serratia marcescens]ELL0335978.1 FAD:protein FMN transferase [Serratia marcescens]MBH2548192.1 FAD:protein FMN transferase [Serratia marcescens]
MRALAMKNWLTGVALSATLLLTGCGPEQVDLTGKTMGTSYSIRYVAGDDTPSAREMQAEIDKRLEQVNDQMSTYRPDSELSRFNASRDIDRPFPVSPATAKVVREALRINRVTDGALDVTVGPLVNLWGFGPEGRPDKVPSEAELAHRRAWTGAEKLSVQGSALVKSIPELYVDLSSIAKGYGVDVVAEYLQSQHVKDYMVDIGGEVRTRGRNGEQKPWRIAIERPTAGTQQQAQLVIQPGEMSIATSGDYRNYFEQDGVRYSHTIDPITGRPINHRLVSITVLSPACMTADGLSTGLNVMGPERGMALANLLGIPVFMIVKTADGFEERYSDAFKPYLKKRS